MYLCQRALRNAPILNALHSLIDKRNSSVQYMSHTDNKRKWLEPFFVATYSNKFQSPYFFSLLTGTTNPILFLLGMVVLSDNQFGQGQVSNSRWNFKFSLFLFRSCYLNKQEHTQISTLNNLLAVMSSITHLPLLCSPTVYSMLFCFKLQRICKYAHSSLLCM